MSWEVWTMKSKMSFFDPTLLKKNISRFAPAWAILTLALFLSLPLPLMRRLAERYGVAVGTVYRFNAVQRLLEDALPMGVVYAFLAAILFAALVFKYLHRTGDAYMMHAFPMTRSCQYLTNAVSGLLFWIVPTLFNGLCVLGILAAYGVTDCGGLVWSTLGYWLLAYLCFYGIAVFAMHLSGRTVIAVLSYGALNFMFLGIPLLCLLLVRLYFTGFDYSVPQSIIRLAPIVELLWEEQRELWMFWVYGGVGLALLVLSWALYRLRHVERAGDPMVYGWARIAFRLLFTLCCTLGLGWILASIFRMIDGSRGLFLPFALIGCFLGWFGASMMIERSVKVFRNGKVWLGFAACAAVLVLAVGGLKYDILGFQRKVPETAKVESVEIWTTGGYGEQGTDCIELTQAADIDVVRAFHEKAIRDTENRYGARSSFWYYEDGLYSELHILYHLQGGGTLRRVYRVPESEYGPLAALYSRPEIARDWYERNLPEKYIQATLEGYTEDMELDEQGNPVREVTEHICRDPGALRQAILADVEAGRLPVVNFLNKSVGGFFCGFGGGSAENVYALWIYFELDDPDGANRWLGIRICSTATETLKLFLR